MCGNSPGGYFHTVFIYKGLAHFGGLKYDIQYNLGFFWKIITLWDIKFLWLNLGVITKLDYFSRSFLYIFFYMVNVQSGTIFGVC